MSSSAALAVSGAVIAVDTSIGTSVAALAADGTVLFAHQEQDTRRHAERIGPLLEQAHAALRTAVASGAAPLALVVVGMGPGPFTGLRVGIVAARAFAFGAGVPVVGVVGHDALAAASLAGDADADEALAEGAEFLLHTDARRRERYWSRYRVTEDGVPERLGEPLLASAEDLPHPELARRAPDFVDAAWIARLGAAAHARGEDGPAQALYLRSPDVTVAPPKRVGS